MRILKAYMGRPLWRSYGLVFRIGLLTAGVILLFQMVNLLVMYRYMKLDFYLCLVAVLFLSVGFLLNRPRSNMKASAANQPAQHDNVNPIGELKTVEIEKQEIAGSPPLTSLSILSAKEWQVLKLVSEGKTNKEVAAIQFIELSTVKSHLNNIYGKLSVSNRKEARVKYAELAAKWPVQ